MPPDRPLLACVVIAALFTAVTLLGTWSTDAQGVRAVGVFVSVVVLAGAAVLVWRRSRPPVARDRVEQDAERITHAGFDGHMASVVWEELEGVDVLTTSSGPWDEDVFLVLLGPEQAPACVIPQGSAGFQPLIERVLALPGFDHQEFVRAMASASERRSVCWRRASRPAA
jgi:hypothetical protein